MVIVFARARLAANVATAMDPADERREADDETMEPVFIDEGDGEVVADLDEEVRRSTRGVTWNEWNG